MAFRMSSRAVLSALQFPPLSMREATAEVREMFSGAHPDCSRMRLSERAIVLVPYVAGSMHTLLIVSTEEEAEAAAVSFAGGWGSPSSALLFESRLFVEGDGALHLPVLRVARKCWDLHSRSSRRRSLTISTARLIVTACTLSSVPGDFDLVIARVPEGSHAESAIHERFYGNCTLVFCD